MASVRRYGLVRAFHGLLILTLLRKQEGTGGHAKPAVWLEMPGVEMVVGRDVPTELSSGKTKPLRKKQSLHWRHLLGQGASCKTCSGCQLKGK